MKAHVRLRGRRWYAIVEAPKDAGGNRKRKWRRLPAGLRGKKEAETEAAKLIVKMSGATYLEPSKTALSVYLDRWLDHMRSQVSPRTRENYGEVVTILARLLGNVPLSKLKPAEIAKAWSDALKSGRRNGKGGLSARSVQLMHRVLSQALKQAVKWELLESNPAAAVKPPRVERKQMKVLDAEQTAALIEFARGRPRMFMPVLLSALCGLRRGEVAALRWMDVDFDHQQLSVCTTIEQTADGLREKPPKSAKSRTVALPAIVLEELRRHRLQQARDLLRLGVRQSGATRV